LSTRIERDVLLGLLKSRRLLIDEIQSTYNVPDEVLDEILWRNQELVSVDGRVVSVKNPLELALRLLEEGVSIGRISEVLDWRDFEQLASHVMSEHGFMVETNVMLTTPVRIQIDVVGVDVASGIGIAVDCKHWNHNTKSKLIEAGLKQVERVRKISLYYEYFKKRYSLFNYVREVIPIILTLQTPLLRVYSGVIYVSAREFNSFLREYRYVMDLYEVKPVKIGKE